MQTQTCCHTLRRTSKGRYYMSMAGGSFERVSREDARQELCEAKKHHTIIDECKSAKGKQWVIYQEI